MMINAWLSRCLLGENGLVASTTHSLFSCSPSSIMGTLHPRQQHTNTATGTFPPHKMGMDLYNSWCFSTYTDRTSSVISGDPSFLLYPGIITAHLHITPGRTDRITFSSGRSSDHAFYSPGYAPSFSHALHLKENFDHRLQHMPLSQYYKRKEKEAYDTFYAALKRTMTVTPDFYFYIFPYSGHSIYEAGSLRWNENNSSVILWANWLQSSWGVGRLAFSLLGVTANLVSWRLGGDLSPCLKTLPMGQLQTILQMLTFMASASSPTLWNEVQ